MKHGIELNGVANITLLLSIVEENMGLDHSFSESLKAITDIKEQLILLERYMLAQQTAKDNNTTPPFWHEVRENPSKFPTNRERHG